MKLRSYLLLFLLGIGVVLAVAVFQRNPGYMDAEYYDAGGIRLAKGYGFSEPFLWNYLDDPAGLPHPSHAYWMPLASILAAFGMNFTGSAGFSSARLIFLLLTGFLPPLTAALSYSLIHRREAALLAGALAVVPAFYLSYLGTTDTFSVYMVLGALWFLVVGYGLENRGSSPLPSMFFLLQPFLLGLLAGLMHLTRADGLLWLLLSLTAAVILAPHSKTRVSVIAWVLLGYLLIMGPWMLRNSAVFGSPLSPGGARALWLTSYDQLYAYPASLLTPEHWWASGMSEILRVRLFALGQNLQSALAVQGEIFLAPLVLLGVWRLRQDIRVRLGLLAWLLTLAVMSFVFPYAGWRGGFFHSGSALQPLIWAIVPAGFESFVEWGVRIRRWNSRQASAFFRVGIVALAVMLSLLIVRSRVIGSDLNDPIWGQSTETYLRLEGALRASGAPSQDVVMVNNVPGYYLASGRPAISIPDGDLNTLLEAARRYGAGYLLLEYNHPRGLNDLFARPGDRPGLKYVKTFEGTRIFRIVNQ